MNKHMIFVVAVLTVFVSTSVSSLEFGAEFRFGNFGFSENRESADLTYEAEDIAWGLAFHVGEKIQDNLRIDVDFRNDPVLRKISYTTISYLESIISLGVGPFFGFLNSEFDPILKPGILAEIKFDFPGLLFAGVRTESTINTRLVTEFDYIQERTIVDLGFYVYNAICTLSMDQKKFTQLVAGGEVVDSLLAFSFDTEIYQKNTPYKVNIGVSYEMLSKYFSTPDVTHSLGAIIMTTGIEFNITEAVFFSFDVDASIYSFGYDELLALSSAPFLINGRCGIKVNIDRFIQLGRIE